MQAQRFRYRHMDMTHLDEQLTAAKDARMKLIATDGVFSMDGDIAPLKEIVSLARKHGAQVFVDECHATGVLGETGRGTDEACGVLGEVWTHVTGLLAGCAPVFMCGRAVRTFNSRPVRIVDDLILEGIPCIRRAEREDASAA